MVIFCFCVLNKNEADARAAEISRLVFFSQISRVSIVFPRFLLCRVHNYPTCKVYGTMHRIIIGENN